MKQDCTVYGGFAFSSMRLRQTTKIPFVPLQYNMANKNTVLLSLKKTCNKRNQHHIQFHVQGNKRSRNHIPSKGK
jgi:hypothetical protein